MYNDSLETLLLRHYGNTAPMPSILEQRLVTSIRQQAVTRDQEQRAVQRLQTYRVSRRRALQLVALGSSGVGLLSLGLQGLRGVEMALLGQDVTQHALP